MALDESSALDVTAVRALETDDRARALWSDADRAWASRAAAEVIGEGGSAEAFLAQRARLALGRAGERSKVLPHAVRYLRWRPWVGTVIVIAAFVVGVWIDRIGYSQQINVLAPPVLLLLLWTIGAYVVLAVGFVRRYGDAAPAGPFRRKVIWLARELGKPRGGGQLRAAVVQLVGDWSRISAPLYAARVGRILHLAAAALAAGLLAGLYLRGIALEYLASWESTFLTTAESVHRVLAIALAPGAALTGIPVPAVSEIEAIRAPAGENAARWLHLMAATVTLLVIVPRLLLALFAWVLERHRSTHLLALNEPYFERLLRGFRGGPVRVHVLPYSYTVPPPVEAGLERLVARAFGGSAAVTITAPVTYGGEDAFATAARPQYAGSVIALFNATATPERATHGAFLDAIAVHLGTGSTLVALVDESAFRVRLGSEPARLEDRRRAWRELCTDRHVPWAFADLEASDLAEAQAELERALEETAR